MIHELFENNPFLSKLMQMLFLGWFKCQSWDNWTKWKMMLWKCKGEINQWFSSVEDMSDEYKWSYHLTQAKIPSRSHITAFNLGQMSNIRYSCARKFGHPCAAAKLLAISPDVYNVALCQLLLR